MACLPRESYDNGFETGCSTGLMTKLLARRCKTLLAVDSAPTAVRSARRNLADIPNVTVEHAVIPDELPDTTFDLIVATEILYYFTNTDLTRILDGLSARLRPNGDLVIAHWRAADRSYGYDGFNVHDTAQRHDALRTVVHHEDENFVLTILRPQR